MPIFITGSTGFIGNKLALKLAGQGETIHALCRRTSDVSTLKHPNIKIFYGDVNEYSKITEAMRGCEFAYHLAAYARGYAKDKNEYFRINVEGTKNICDAALKNGTKKIVITSTIVTFGPTGKNPESETIKRNENVFYTTYEHSKYLAEKVVEEYIKKGLNAVTVNPTRVFGPGLMNESNSVTIMIQMYLKGKMRAILGDGKGIGNYGYVDDMVAGHIAAMEKGRVGEKYILGGENVSYNHFFQLISEITGKRFFQFKIPYPVAITFSKFEEMRAKLFGGNPLITPEWVKTFALDWVYSSKKAEQELGYKYTPLRESMRQTIDWLNKQK